MDTALPGSRYVTLRLRARKTDKPAFFKFNGYWWAINALGRLEAPPLSLRGRG